MTDAETRRYLKENGYPEHIVRGGRAGLVERWKCFVDEVERGYEFGLEDYRNDLDIRGVIQLVGADDEVADEDERFRAMLRDTDRRVWESGAGELFWDFGYPRNASSELIASLRSEGVID
jgi:hypothetical protein